MMPINVIGILKNSDVTIIAKIRRIQFNAAWWTTEILVNIYVDARLRKARFSLGESKRKSDYEKLPESNSLVACKCNPIDQCQAQVPEQHPRSKEPYLECQGPKIR